jgi:outer membrane protein
MRFLILIVTTLLMHTGWGQTQQDTLAFQDVVSIALAGNFEISMSKNQEAIAQNNNTPGNAGFLPVVSGSVDANRASRDSRLAFFNGQLVEADGAVSEAFNAMVHLDWIVFDGFKMFATKRKLQELEKLGSLEVRFQIEQVIESLADIYYRLVQEEKLLAVYRNTAKLSGRQLEITSKSLELGGKSELELLNASVARNTDSARVLEQIMLIQNLKADLNELMGRSPEWPFEVSRNLEWRTDLSYAELTRNMLDDNAGLRAARVRQSAARQEIEEIRANMYPAIGVFADYALNRQRNEVGILATNFTRGSNVGVSLRWNLFNGLNDKREIQNRKILFENARLEQDRISLESQRALYQQYNAYTFAKTLYKLEDENFKTTQRNLEVALRSYDLGAISDIDLRIIQLTELEAASRRLRAEYLCKTAEIRLRRLSGNLLASIGA